MLQIIGLIVAVYAICRLALVAFEMTEGTSGVWKGLPFMTRFIIVAVISGIGVLTLVVLTACLLLSGQQRPMNGF